MDIKEGKEYWLIDSCVDNINTISISKIVAKIDLGWDRIEFCQRKTQEIKKRILGEIIRETSFGKHMKLTIGTKRVVICETKQQIKEYILGVCLNDYETLKSRIEMNKKRVFKDLSRLSKLNIMLLKFGHK